MDRILVVDDEAGMRRMLDVILRRDGYEVLQAADRGEAEALLAEQEVDVVLTDLRMEDRDGGLQLLAHCRKEHPSTFVIVMTAFAEWDTAVLAMRQGAYNFLQKPFDNDLVRSLVKRAVAAREHYLIAKASGSQEIAVHLIGTSPCMHQIQDLVDQVSTTDATVLVTGPSGSGKELIARAIHYGSLRADGPLVRVNAGALTPSLLESELFGHVKGSFTGAIEDRPGLFSLADGGTLFLDEIGELALETQVRLLRVLENREFLPVGGRELSTCDVRVVAATNKNLKRMVAAGTFREDLYYRLAVITVDMPPLKDRAEDIPLLAGHLLARHAVRLRRGITGFTQEAMRALQSYEWPGNIRELDNRIQRGAALTHGDTIDLEQLFGDIGNTNTGMWRNIMHREGSTILRRRTATSPALEPRRTGTGTASVNASNTGAVVPETTRESRDLVTHLRDGGTVDLNEEVERFEKALVATALRACDNNLTESAKRLGLSFRQIRYKAKLLGLR